MRTGRPVVLAWLFLMTAMVAPFCWSAIERQQAEQAAADFARVIGLPLGEGAEITLEPAWSRFGPQWVLRYLSASEIAVDANDGTVVRGINYDAIQEHTQRATETKMTESEAALKASEIVHAMGVTREFAEPRPVELRTVGEERTKWLVSWVRVCKGIPFYRDTATACFDPTTARVLSASKGFWSLPPESTDVEVTQEAALESARQYASALGFPEGNPPPSAGLKIVQPNDYWGPNGEVRLQYPARSRVAWVVTFTFKVPYPGAEAFGYKEFWIDAKDGSLLGGTQSRGPEVTEKAESPGTKQCTGK